MDRFILLFTIFTLTISGCYSKDSLRRTPSKERKMENRQKSTVTRKKISDDEDRLFNTVFKRNPQKFEDRTGLSEREKELFRRNDVRNDPAVKSLHRERRKSETKNSDWVFGTENGSYF